MDLKQKYIFIEGTNCPVTVRGRLLQVFRRSVSGELFKGLWLVLREMLRFNIHTTQYPKEKLPLSPRYRAIHELLRLLESGNERCIGCGLCEKICISNCIRMETSYGEDGRKKVHEYTINFGRCIFCGFCAEVCPELAIVHGGRYENASEQRAHFGLKEDMLTPMERFMNQGQKEFPGFGALSQDADSKVKKTPLAYFTPKGEENV
ncbi:NADH-quinone oxidoreductase subunit NuoI [Wolinella succinogenes]|uniref:NADH-quinone oxidoreductase subunit I n=1 Tax=Wolinella succinogenes (strain ATCC 29543 / DSM 1740 / CCUG 13145 / JCM 31913 / LMG 7466 / NCTC 11488 / FDC 602W) TaxID=273121 RepID=NUOI_WOLSU|nr:NADH-quinone oxidoreductase subunit NuoI [Wolinella succinogenes]Q7MA42.1 RecName: Full=NADH-quinone oxidoreductase subunit I; AltName: Full=NADH dehydrogenase I subunit I; AltName: Full=NDH-1 subunit I [Wolinella succinogenes DSM 1740]NLU33986.1 NADH-quinone oxidoreductase subunit NuoI [Wolinella succinogenes]CAE09622.1 NADH DEHYDROGENASE I CHAIN I [Wolinella succinogenes]HCZ19243.1 NADH-quinone oxidoreductase subunit NuoI [Helicobacter sp.]